MKLKNGILPVLLLGLCLAGCDKRSTLPERTEQQKVYLYVNTFAFNRINQYYLWNEEVAAALKDWKTADEPIAKVQSVRYRDDRWTLLTDDVDSFYDSTTGHRKGFGFEVGMDLSAAQLIVLYTYAGSPAEEAGLKRGDAITSLNGSPIPTQDYSAFIKQALRNKDRVTLGMKSGATIQLTARDMYENPVLLSKIFDCGGKKVGYLAYTSFTLDSYKDLISICKAFKQAGVSELILDLRYNGGGFVLAEQFFASMLAPEAEVKAKSVLSTEVYNSKLTAQYAKEGVDNRSYFTTEFKFSTTDGQKYDFSTADANVGISKLYAIISSGTASASEALLCDLYPYMDITLVGAQTHGKFCTGWLFRGPDFYKETADESREKGVDPDEGKRYTENWALYLMYARFADKDGVTRCMPDGLTPDYAVKDNPKNPCPLGDPQEDMLARALALCGYPAPAPAAHSLESTGADDAPVLQDYDRPGFGVYLKLP